LRKDNDVALCRWPEDISGGQISMGERIVSAANFSIPPEKRDIGMVFQSYAIWPHMSVAENVAFGLKIKKMSAGVIEQKVKAALERVGLEKYADRGASQLSGGQQQRVALARAIVLEPTVLLFDEPLSNLDAKLRERMRFELRELLQGLGITSIYVTHDQQEAMVVADRIVLMNEGSIDQIGSPTDIYYRPKTMFGAEFVGLANKLRGHLVANGANARVRLSDGIEISGGSSDAPVGTVVDLVVRPEMLRLSASELSGPNVLKGKAEITYFLGNIGDIYLSVGQHQLRGQLSPPAPWAPGQDIWVGIDPASVLIYRAPGEASVAQAA
jgi:iron(III) transport system ATP-binding protein